MSNPFANIQLPTTTVQPSASNEILQPEASGSGSSNNNNSSNTTTAGQALSGAHPSGIVPLLQNIVATVNLDCRLDLKTIALHARNAEYNPKRFAAVIMRIREPKTTALIFASGKMYIAKLLLFKFFFKITFLILRVVTGAKSEDLSKLAARKYARIIQKLGFPAKCTTTAALKRRRKQKENRIDMIINLFLFVYL